MPKYGKVLGALAPQITDAGELISLDAMIEYETVMMFTPSGAGVTTVDLADDGLAAAIDDAPADEFLLRPASSSLTAAMRRPRRHGTWPI